MRSNKYLISIIIPVYNAKSYVSRCLDSIKAQDYINWEVIIVNDGSTDGVEDILNEYAEIDSRIKPINIENAGVSNARNVGLSKAIGEYVYFLDVDDWIEPNTLSLLADAAIEGFDIVQGAYDEVYDDGKVSSELLFLNVELIDTDAVLSEYLLGNIKQSVWNKLIKRELTKGINFDTKLAVAEDTKFVYELCKVCSNVKLIDTVTYHYFVRANSCMNVGLSEKHFQGLQVVDTQLFETMGNKSLYPKCVRKEAVLCLDLIHAINIENKFKEKLPELRKRVVSKLYYILTSKHFSLKFKAGVILLSICPPIFYKFFGR